MTIEERAREHWPQPFIDYGIRFYNKQMMRDAYMMGAREQKKIDIDKACDFLRNYEPLWQSDCIASDLINRLTQAMEK